MSAGSQYRLDADDSKLSPHVGHKVEVTGTVEDHQMSGSTSTGGTTPPSTGGTSTGGSSMSATNAPRLKVDTVRMVSSTCP
jgi:hypothetical protein